MSIRHRPTRPRTSPRRRLRPGAPAITTGTVKFVTEPADAEIMIQGIRARRRAVDGRPSRGHPPGRDRSPGLQGVADVARAVGARGPDPARRARAAGAAAQTRMPRSRFRRRRTDSRPCSTASRSRRRRRPRRRLKVGPHTIAVKQHGVEVWHQQFTAEASSDYEFNPSFTADKQRERGARRRRRLAAHAAPRARGGRARDAPAETSPAPAAAEPAPMATTRPKLRRTVAPRRPSDGRARRAAAGRLPAGPADRRAAADAAATDRARRAAAADRRQALVPQHVRNIAGATHSRVHTDVPSMISAKLCIDRRQGRRASVLTKLDRQAAEDLADALQAPGATRRTPGGAAGGRLLCRSRFSAQLAGARRPAARRSSPGTCPCRRRTRPRRSAARSPRPRPACSAAASTSLPSGVLSCEMHSPSNVRVNTSTSFSPGLPAILSGV